MSKDQSRDIGYASYRYFEHMPKNGLAWHAVGHMSLFTEKLLVLNQEARALARTRAARNHQLRRDIEMAADPDHPRID